MWRLTLLLCVTLTLCSANYDTVDENVPAVMKPYTFTEKEIPYLRPIRDWWGNDTERVHKCFLCLDGGALKGIVPTNIMIELEKQIKTHIINNLDDYEVFNVKEGKTKDDFNLNTINDFEIYLADFFDGISGISAGSWITSYLVTKGGYGAANTILHRPSNINKYGYNNAGSLQGLRVFFLEYGRRIYPPPSLGITWKAPGFFRPPTFGFKPLTEPSYTPAGLEWLLKEFVGDVKLSEVSTSMFVVAFDLYRLSAIEFVADYLDTDAAPHRPVISSGVAISKIQTNDDYMPKPIPRGRKLKGDVPDVTASPLAPVKASEVEGMDKIYDLDYYVRDIVRSSSAFPMLHPSKLLKPLNDITYYFDMIDGAMIGNNPTLPTLAWAVTHIRVKDLSQLALLSLGTGFTTGSFESLGAGGLIQWQGPIIDLVMSSTPEFLHSVMDYVFYTDLRSEECPSGKQYELEIQTDQLLRIQLIRDDDSADGEIIDAPTQNYEQLKALEEMAKLLAAHKRENLKKFVRNFMLRRTSKVTAETASSTTTEAPATPSPSEVPVTPSPSEVPVTPSPSEVPVTPSPSEVPVTPSPSEAPALTFF